MKRNITLLIVGGLALAGAGMAGGYWYAMQRMGSMTTPQPVLPQMQHPTHRLRANENRCTGMTR